jgi:integrase
MGTFKSSDVKALVAKMKAAGVKPETMRAHMIPVKALFGCAVEDEDIRQSRAGGKIGLPSMPPRAADEERRKHLTAEKLALVLAALPGGEWRAFFTFLAQTGMRISEACAIT